MTDSEDDLLESYQYSFRNEGMAIRAKGPNIDFETVSLPSSTMQMLPGTVNQPKYDHINNGQRSLYHRRETSPMSMYNVSHFSRPYYRNFSARSQIASHQSVYNRGNRSPASIRSLDSTATFTASDIVVALNNEQFSKYDQNLLRAACYKFLKNKSRKRLEYMRNRRIIMNKIRKRRPSEDLGELASESSSSSEKSISPKILQPKPNVKIDKKNVNQACIGKKYTNICDKNQDQNREETIVSNTASKLCTNNTNENSFLLKDRFKKGFLLPSQRFSNSNNNPSPSETNLLRNSNKTQVPDLIRQCSRDLKENQNDEEIFSVPTNGSGAKNSRTDSRKRTIDSNEQEVNPKAPKQMKTNAPEKTDALNSVKDITKNDFNFARPQMPITKFSKLTKKKMHPEILISKSSQPLSIIDEAVKNTLSPISKQQPIAESTKQSEEIDMEKRNSIDNESLNTTDISKRPSFIKRKLFTQKLDIIETKIDTPQSSPQVNKYIGKEKNKPRKLALSQSCLSRDVEDNNNLLNLLHKIVPADQMSLINSTKTDKANRKSDGTNWDIDSVLSTCNADDGSETYTDEEILANEEDNKSNDQRNVTFKEVENQQKRKANEKTNKGLKGNENSTKTNEKSFWDTDIESDWESNVFLPYKLNDCQKKKPESHPRVNKVNEKNKSVVSTSFAKNINTKILKFDAIKNTGNNCQPSIWDTDFESDLESYGILPKKSGYTKLNKATTKNNNTQENSKNKNVPGISKTKKNNPKFDNVDLNKTVTNNCQKSFWDTDFESDIESCGISSQAKKSSKVNTTVTAKNKMNKENCENKNSTVQQKCQKVDANKKLVKNQAKAIWDTDFESDPDLSNKSGLCKTNVTAIDRNGSNTENYQNNGSVAMQTGDKRIMIVKCQRINVNVESSDSGQKLSQSIETESKNKKPIFNKRVKKDQDNKEVDSFVNKNKTAMKRTPKKCIAIKNVNKKAKEIQKNSPEPDNNVYNVSGRWTRANRRANNSITEIKAKDSIKIVPTQLISHRMTRQKTKLLNSFDTTVQPNESTDFNISVRSLRPRKKRVPKW